MEETHQARAQVGEQDAEQDRAGAETSNTKFRANRSVGRSVAVFLCAAGRNGQRLQP